MKLKIKILVDETHYNKEFGNKESTIDKIDFYIREFCGSNIEYQYSTIRRSFGNLLRTYKSAFRGKSLMKHTEKTFRSMWHKYVPVNLEQYWFVPLSMQMEWYPVKDEWKMSKEKKAVLYRYQPPKDWDLIDNYSFENIGDKMISQDEKVVNKYWDDLEARELIYSILKGKWLSSGERVDKFEHEFSKKFNFKQSVMVNSGSSANLVM